MDKAIAYLLDLVNKNLLTDEEAAEVIKHMLEDR